MVERRSFKELIVIQESKKKIKAGDIFVFQPKPGVFLWGKVIKVKIKSKEGFCDGMHLVFVYNTTTPDYDCVPELKPENFLLAPIVINAKGWRDGYFYTVANQPVREEELNVSYGFWNEQTKRFQNEHGDIIDKIPEWKAGRGLYSFRYVGGETHRLLYDDITEQPSQIRSIFEEDLAEDMRYDIQRLLKNYKAEEAFRRLKKDYESSFSDYDEGPLAIVILAKLQIEHGLLWKEVKEKAIEAIYSGKVIRLLEHASSEVVAYNQKQLEELRASIDGFQS